MQCNLTNSHSVEQKHFLRIHDTTRVPYLIKHTLSMYVYMYTRTHTYGDSIFGLAVRVMD